MQNDADRLRRRMFAAAVEPADPMGALRAALPLRPDDRVVGADNSGARVAQAIGAAWGRCEELVSVPLGATHPTSGIEPAQSARAGMARSPLTGPARGCASTNTTPTVASRNPKV